MGSKITPVTSTDPANGREYWHRSAAYYQSLTDHPYQHNASWRKKINALMRIIAERGLAHGRVLEVGCHIGLLQDLVPDYVGVDISTGSSRLVYKPFYACSATALPFADSTFDAAWSIWVMEHVDQPEAMLAEMRRVVKPGGTIFLCVAYAVDSWVSQGLHKRPFRDLTPRQQLIKLTLPVRASAPYKIAATLPRRLLHLLRYLVHRQPTELHYGRLQPNFETYWDYDADACSSIDAYQVALYFLSRGDRPYYRSGPVRSLLQRSQPQAYIVQK